MTQRERIVSKSVHRRHRSRRRAYLDWASGEGVLDTGKAIRTPPSASLSRVVEEVPPETQQVFLCGQGQGKGGLLAWLKEPKLLEEWEDAGTHPEKDRFVIRLRHQKTERRLELYSLSTWFGPDAGPREARAAFALLGELLASKFPGAVVLPTPAQTGLDLWDRRKSGSEYPILPEDIRELIRSTSTQGRVQTDLAVQEELPGFFYLDTRFAYAAFTWKMPVGNPTVDEKPIRDPYRPGRYLIRFRVPNEWSHIGIFGVPRKEYVAGSNRNWDYPSEPGTVWETWVDHAELLVAEQERFGWDFEILQRILFEQPDRKGAAPEPLKAWRNKLVELREWVEAAPQWEVSESMAKLLSGALRNILLQTIGAFHGSRRKRYHTILKHQLHQVPSEYMGNLGTPEGNYLTYWELEPVSRYRLEHSHPEWSATIWAKSHARTLYSNRFGQGETGALALPRQDLVAIRNDALYLARDPGWSETGRIGELRKKGAITRPVWAPKTDSEDSDLNDLRDRSEREWRRG